MDIYEFYSKFAPEIHEIFDVVTINYPYTHLFLFIKMLFYNNTNIKHIGCFDWYSYNEVSNEKIEEILRFYDDVLVEYLSFGIIYLTPKDFIHLIAHGDAEDRHDNSNMSFDVSDDPC